MPGHLLQEPYAYGIVDDMQGHTAGAVIARLCRSHDVVISLALFALIATLARPSPAYAQVHSGGVLVTDISAATDVGGALQR